MYSPSVSLGQNLEVPHHHADYFHKFSFKFLFVCTSHFGNLYSVTVDCTIFYFTWMHSTAFWTSFHMQHLVIKWAENITHFGFNWCLSRRIFFVLIAVESNCLIFTFNFYVLLSVLWRACISGLHSFMGPRPWFLSACMMVIPPTSSKISVLKVSNGQLFCHALQQEILQPSNAGHLSNRTKLWHKLQS